MDRSYIGTYGITGVWAGWLMSRGASYLLAEPPSSLQRAEVAPICRCGNRMVRRPGVWKCYRHAKPIVVVIAERLPRAPQVELVGVRGRNK